ncbi:MAG: enoyl-CoA hydratase-related protein, partial [Nitrospinota bacterium]
RAITFPGAGEEAFSAGADIGRFAEERRDSASARRYAERFEAGVEVVDSCSKPTLSLIKGFCVGGGCELASATDIRVAAENARFGVPVARLGLVAGYGELRRFVNLIGPGRTLDMMLSARLFDAREAFQMGFVSALHPLGRVDEEGRRLAARIAELAPLVHAWHKRFVRTLLKDPGLERLSEGELALQYACFDTEDFREGTRAFLEKRKPRFRGR